MIEIRHIIVKTKERLILYPLLILSMYNLKNNTELIIRIKSANNQLTNKYFDSSNPVKEFTKTRIEHVNKINLAIFILFEVVMGVESN